MSVKTEPPTRRRLEKARAEGDLPVSGALVRAASLLVAVALLPAAVRAVAAQASESIRSAIHSPSTTDVAATLAADVTVLTVPIVAAMTVAGAAAGLLQTGGAVSLHRVAPDLRRASPLAGLGGLFGWARTLAAAGAVALALAVAYATARGLLAHGAELAAVVGNRAAIGPLIEYLATRLGWVAAWLVVGFAAVHAVAVRAQWHARLRMTRSELRQEARAAAGDPELRAARRRAHEQLLID
jgi:flagellar biosynthesis protein FlhB